MASSDANKLNPAGTAAVCYKLALPEATSLGLVLWDVRFVKEGPVWYLRIYIDKEDGYISIDDCTAMSRRMDKILDKEDPIPHAYCLEISSPGIERELVRPEHFERYMGFPVAVRLYRPYENQRELRGTLTGFDNNSVEICTDEKRKTVFLKKDISSVHLTDEYGDEYTEGETDNE